ncbi:MAG: hypothetical protein QOF89_3504 [Acidobacteriota bacterium]|jgi:tetratricopeptide (TPR) repeat protein|nr:hypothetical protein [Acidobacteriota bacterium]
MVLKGRDLRIIQGACFFFLQSTCKGRILSREEEILLEDLEERLRSAMDALYEQAGTERAPSRPEVVAARLKVSLPWDFTPVEAELVKAALTICRLDLDAKGDALVVTGLLEYGIGAAEIKALSTKLEGDFPREPKEPQGFLFQEEEFQLDELEGCTLERLVGHSAAKDESPHAIFLKATNRHWQRFYLDAGLGFWDEESDDEALEELAGEPAIDYGLRFGIVGARIGMIQCDPCPRITIALSSGVLTLEAREPMNLESSSRILFHANGGETGEIPDPFQHALRLYENRHGESDAGRLTDRLRSVIAVLSPVVSDDPTHADAFHLLGLCWCELPQRSRESDREAEAAFRAVLALKPDHSYANLFLAHVLFDTERYPEAFARFNRFDAEYFREQGQAWRILKNEELQLCCRLYADSGSVDPDEVMTLCERYESDPEGELILPREIVLCLDALIAQGAFARTEVERYARRTLVMLERTGSLQARPLQRAIENLSKIISVPS